MNNAAIYEGKAHENTFHISTENFSKLNDIMYEQTFQKGDILFWEGDTADKLFYIKQGKAKVTKATNEGKQYVLHMFQEGDLLGEFSGFNKMSYSF